MANPFGNDMDRTPSQTESTAERGLDADVDEVERGSTDTLDEDEPGDIADEGSAHRG